VKCYHCNSTLKLKDMRKHVGRHVLTKTLANQHTAVTCGFCGRLSCSNQLEQTSRRGAVEFFRMKSDCSYRVLPKKQPTKFSTRNICSNGLLRCHRCAEPADVWKYNMSIHFAEVHDSNHTPEEWVISDDERRGLITDCCTLLDNQYNKF
jgi:hypothetical protein